MSDDLSQAKVGDQLFVHGRWRSSLVKVKRITPGGRIVTEHSTFRPDGRQIGASGYDTTFARIATAEDIAKVKRNISLSAVSHFSWEKLSDDDLKTVSEIIAKYKLPGQS